MTPGTQLWTQPVSLGIYALNQAPSWNNDSASGQLAIVGIAPGIIMRFQPWVGAAWSPWDAAWAADAAAHSCMPMVSWEGRDYTNNSPTQPSYSNAAVTRGDWDATLITWLTAAGAWGKPFLLRFFWEMNGQWYPWAQGANGNTPGSLIDAFRHVARLVRTYAPLAQIVWCPGTSGGGWGAFEDCYPGNAYVDVLGLDFYNTGTAGWSVTWQEFSAIKPYYDRIVALAPGKRVLICETGCAVQSGHDKAAWYANIKLACDTMPAIAGIVEFDNQYGGMDFRVSADSTVAAAWQTLAHDPAMQGRWT